MEVILKGEPDEIAALAAELQERQISARRSALTRQRAALIDDALEKWRQDQDPPGGERVSTCEECR